MKKTAALLVLFIMLVNLILPVFADGGKLTTDKTEYTEGEPIIVKAEGSGKDWVGIYLTTDTLGTDQSIRWYYVAQDGNSSGEEKDIRKAEYTNSSRSEYAGLPAGEYVIYLCENDGYNVISKVSVTVKPGESSSSAPSAPSSVVYDRTATAPGLADGTLTITAGEGSAPDRYIAYWADEKGALVNYTAFAPIEYGGRTTKYTMVSSTLIPKSADRIIVYSAKGKQTSESAAEVMLPEGCNSCEFPSPNYELQVLSDIHLNSTTSHIHNKHFAAALEQIKEISPSSLGIFINGDIADHAQLAEYKTFNRMIKSAGEGLPPVYCAIGNHDLADGPFDSRLKTFLDNTEPGIDTVYYDMWISGIHFIFLGSETPGLNADLSAKQLKWFKEKLAENRDENRPVYVFLHQGIIDTVAGTFAYQKWHGINQTKKFCDILKDFPEVILFSGHSHWEMDSANTMKAKDDKLPTIFNTASCGYLWNDDAMTTNVGIEGAQGYFFYAYSDKILALGRDFASGKWISSAQFCIDLPGGEIQTAPADDEKTDDPAPVDDGGRDVSGTKRGCFGSVGAGAALASAVTMLGLVLLIKKKED